MNLSPVEYILLYSVYSIPNIIFPLLGGLLMDNFGYRIVLFSTSAILTLGQGVFAFGVSARSFKIAFVGRGIFGMGGEVMEMAQTLIIVKWFREKELSIAIGLKSTLSLLGSVLNDVLEPIIVDQNSLDTGLWAGFVLCFISFISMIAAIMVDVKRKKILEEENIVINETKNFKFYNIKKFSPLFWILLVASLGINTSVACFMNIASGFYYDRFNFSKIGASSIMSITYGIAAISCSLVGYVTDRIGKRISGMVLSGFLVTLFHAICIFTPDSNKPVYPIFYLVILGIGHSIYLTVYFSAIPYIVDPNMLGSAYGINYSVINTGIVIASIAVGYFQDISQHQLEYFWPSILLGSLSFTAMIAAILAYFQDINEGTALQSYDPELRRKYGKGLYTLTEKYNT
jgi:MFS family permease